jgi:flagellar biosynthesis protein FlhG
MADQAEGLRKMVADMGKEASVAEALPNPILSEEEKLALEKAADTVSKVISRAVVDPPKTVEAEIKQVEQEIAAAKVRARKVTVESVKIETKRMKVISVASGKGGVGKSNLSVNLSIALADIGYKVLLLDADLGLANVNILLGVIPKSNIFHVIQGKKKLNEIVLTVPQGIDIIAGASGFSELANLSGEVRKNFIRDLGKFQAYDYLVIDTAAGLHSTVLSFIQASQEVIIITTPEPTAITDAYGIIKAIVNLGFTNIKLVVNKVRNIMEGKKVSDRIIQIASQFLKVRINSLGYLYEDEALVRAVKMQEPLVRAFPSSRLAKSFYHLAGVIANRREEAKGADLKTFFRNFMKRKNKKKLQS